MRKVTEGVTEALLISAKKEFLIYGYKDASMRRISSASGVSTNSIYTRFKDKAGLFEAVVQEAADGLMDIYLKSMSKARERIDIQDAIHEGVDGTDLVLKYIFENKDSFKLLFGACEGTKYENYYDELSNIEESYYVLFAKKYMKKESKVDPFFIHVHCRMGWQYIYEILSHDLSYEQAKEFMESVCAFNYAGWKVVLGFE